MDNDGYSHIDVTYWFNVKLCISVEAYAVLYLY